MAPASISLMQAASNPDIGFIGVEPYIAGMAKLLAKIAGAGPCTMSGYTRATRATSLMPFLMPPRQGVSAFSRPLAKEAPPQTAVRLSTRCWIALARVMRPGAELRFATDDPGYLVWALERFIAHACFRWLAQGPPDWRTRPADWPETRYEAKAKASGRPCAYLRFVRR